ncbi:MAG: hypothetical protein C5B53_08990 [Candidatus Melainabacteria bacterium]|nr:MAG: hypothetical protein C5B53_08990 [Candidatus Melainabacteria bacterium]
MRIAFFGHGQFYQAKVPALGARVHIEQLLKRMIARGHDLWSSYPPDNVPEVKSLPCNRLSRIHLLQSMDALYLRVDFEQTLGWWWLIDPLRKMFPVMIWEFNCVPDFARYVQESEGTIARNIADFRRYAKVCDLAICVSETMADYARNRLNLKNTTVIPNGSDPQTFRRDLVSNHFFDSSYLNVVFISGSTLHNQNLSLLTDVARILLARQSKISLHTIGPFSDGKSFLPNMHLHGSVSYENLPYWLACMDVGLCLYPPGPCEFASPLKFFDYFASGLTVISTPQRQVEEILKSINQTEMIVPAADPTAIANLLIALESDRQKVQRLGQAGRELVVNFYNWDRVTTDTLAAIEALRSSQEQWS